MLGGRLTYPHSGGWSSCARVVSVAAGLLLIGAGSLHVSAAGAHTSYPVLMAGFLVTAYLQVALGGLLLARRPGRLVIAGGVAMTVTCVGLWGVSRTVGLGALGGEPTEPVGLKDGVCVLFEIATIPLLLMLASGELQSLTLSSPRSGARALQLLGAGMCVLFVPALVVGGHPHPAGQLHAGGHGQGAAGPAHRVAHSQGHPQLALTGGHPSHATSRHAGRHTTAAHQHSAGVGHASHLTGGGHTGHVHQLAGGGVRHPAGHVHQRGGSGGGHRHTTGGHQHAGGGGEDHAAHPPGAAGGPEHHHHPEPQPENPVTAVTRQVTDLLPPRR